VRIFLKLKIKFDFYQKIDLIMLHESDDPITKIVTNAPGSGIPIPRSCTFPSDSCKNSRGDFLGGNMGFTKLDNRILQSSIMAEDPFTFKIWITLLAACGADGIAECSAMYLESICRIPIDQVKKSLEKLMSCDENSRSTNDDGKRIERVDGGYRIINYLKYRDLSLKSSEAERKRLYRQNIKRPEVSGHCPDSSASISSSVSVSSSERKEVKEKNIIPPPLELVQTYCKQRGTGIDAQSFIDHYEARGWEFKRGQKMKDWQAAVRTWEKNGFNKPKAKPSPYDHEKRIKELMEGL
jgi:hypothetical protein